MDHQRVFLFLVFLQSGCWLAVESEKEIKLSRFRFRGTSGDGGGGHAFNCLHTNCANFRTSPDLYDRCVRLRCPSTHHRLTRSADYRLGLVPVSLPWSFQRFPFVLCPASSMADNEVMRYCTADACYVITSGGQDGATFEREEHGSHCLRMCGDLVEGQYEECVIGECCFGLATSVEGYSALQTMSRKRRVNDDVSQCIQSYCSGFSAFRERLLCIVKNCNRSVLTS